ncbi:uncharacterized protein C11orf16 homolog [Notolabrus celidotus]|uniref:uncharacterized protein C11orf16 homolog n=1 Tax=Notolabrus celidotus TaxID=1203425 RepID=UPI0014905933|nr:uncharacterized protein C11orf16 homolog [Notolabrus celidotus]XP_034542226.1 uncharacterized protein C11orf16 homolog [Notolabrus celidotus]
MTSIQMKPPESALVPLFLGQQRCNITFIVESSEEMRAALGSVKRLLIQTLLTKASHRDSLFNIMTYSGEFTSWSHHMLPCAPDTVYISLSWIHSITCSPGRDLLAALSVALTDPACHAVHLLCKELPEQSEAVLRALPALAAGRPVNMFYLLDSHTLLDTRTRDFLQGVTQTTRGSCYVIPVGLNGVLEKAVPLCVVGNQSLVLTDPPVKCCPPSSGFSPHNTSSPLLRCSLGNPSRPGTSCMMSSQTLRSPEFFPGCRVLARREVDGFYYSGTLIQQVQGCGGVWVVQFDHPGSSSLGVIPSQRQLVYTPDMVTHTRAHTGCLVPGDAVLTPWEPDLKRYGPGRVTVTTERRDGFGVDGVTSLRVLMWDGSVSLVPGSLVSPISAPQHDKIVRELQILKPQTPGRSCGWLCANSSSCTPRQLLCSSWCPSASCCRESMLPTRCRSSFGRTDGFESPEQRKHVDLSDTDVPASSTTSLSPSDDDSRAVKLGSKEQRPPWRYWRRTGSEPQHRQPGSAAVPKRTPQPVRFSFPVPQLSASPNHSSLFQSLPGAKGKRVNIRDAFGATNFKPRPPGGLRPFSANNATSVYT